MRTQKKSGFTLVELMIVAAIVAILAAIVIPLLSSNRDTAVAAEAHNLCGTVATASKVYYAKTGGGPADTDALPQTTQDELDNAKYYDEADITIAWTSPNAWTITVTSDDTVYSTGAAETLTLNQDGTWGGNAGYKRHCSIQLESECPPLPVTGAGGMRSDNTGAVMNKSRTKWWQKEDAIGLDIQQGHIIATRFIENGSGPILKQLATSQYDAADDDHQISQHIRDLWKQEKLPVRTVCSCLHSRAMVVRYFHYENLNKTELSQALELEAEEALQHPAHEISMDWQLNLSSGNNSSKELSGTLIATPKETVLNHLKLIRDAGLYSISVEASCSALANLYSYMTEDEQNEPVCLINMTERTADIVLCSSRGYYPRTLFSAQKPWESNQDYLLENIQNSLLYYHIKLKQSPIKKIILTGRTSTLKEFMDKLSEQTSLPVETLDVLQANQLQKKAIQLPPEYTNLSIATALGLGLKGVLQ